MTEEERQEFITWCTELRSILIDMMAEVLDGILAAWIGIKRVYLIGRLSKWMPDGLAYFIAYHWPERWLPMPEIEETEK